MSDSTAQLHSQWVGRCVYCGRPLKNPDSVEAYSGPICRARHGKAAWLDNFLSIDRDLEAAEIEAAGALVTIQLNDESDVQEASRALLKALSLGREADEADHALKALTHLGYPTVANLVGAALEITGWDGANLNPAELYADGDRIYLRSKYNEAGVKALRGVWGRRWDGALKLNYFPFTKESALSVLSVCSRWWPLTTVDDAIKTMVKGLKIPDAPIMPKEVAKGKPVRLVQDGNWCEIYTPYKKDFVDKIKAQIYWKDRKWDSNKKCWAVIDPMVERVISMLGEFWTDDETDLGSYATRKVNLEKSKALSTTASVSKDDVVEINGRTLYPFQVGGMRFAEMHRRVLIADEMGLGKTVQALAFLNTDDANFPALVVPPASVKMNWCREIMAWLTNDKVSVDVVDGETCYEIGPDGTKAGVSGFFSTMAEENRPDITVMNYDMLSKHEEVIKKQGYKTIIFDEAHYLKNHKSKRGKAAREISRDIPNILMLTGTPVMNRPIELWHLLNILQPYDWSNRFNYAKRYCAASQGRWGWDFSGHSNLDELHEILTTKYMVRRRKKEVLPDLPAKISYRVTLDVEKEDRREYDAAVRDFRDWLVASGSTPEEIAKTMRAKTLAKMTTLKRLAAEAKLNAACENIIEVLESKDDEQLVVFAHHRSVIEGAVEKLTKAGYTVSRIIGGDSTDARAAAVKSFVDGTSRVIVCSILAGGVGIDGLQHASNNVIFLERTWRPADHAQAEDRVNRIGQTEKCFNEYFDMENSIDDRMAKMLEDKAKVASMVADGQAAETAFMVDIIDWLKNSGK